MTCFVDDLPCGWCGNRKYCDATKNQYPDIPTMVDCKYYRFLLKDSLLDEILQEMEVLRIDVDVESFGKSRAQIAKYERANEMLDDCIDVVKKLFERNRWKQ